MWKSHEDVPSTSSSNESNSIEARGGSTLNLALHKYKKRLLQKDSPGLLKRAMSFQILNRTPEVENEAEMEAIRQRYKDTAKVIWKKCPLPPNMKPASSAYYTKSSEPPKDPKMNIPEPTDSRAVLFRPDMDDHKSPYLACTINDVLRSDSSDSSDDEEIMQITRL